MKFKLPDVLAYRMRLTFVGLFFFAASCKKMQEQPLPNDLGTHSKNDDFKNRGVDTKLIADNLVSPIGLVSVRENENRFHDGRDGERNNRKEKEDDRLFIIDQIGKIWIIEHGMRNPIPFLDITSKLVPLSPFYDERGLIGFALHPNFERNGRFFVYYTAPPRPGGPEPGATWNNLSRISEFRVSSMNRNMGDLMSERPILELNDPQSNHNGGTLDFGDDGYLYISIGDGGGANDVGPGHVRDWYAANEGGNGQDIDSNLFGNILRLDVDHGAPYTIPRDNPFVGRRGLDEIYAYGFRNPFRFSFDMGGSHQLIAGDAGQVLWEKKDLVKKGGNYGWNVKEGRHCFSTANPSSVPASCPMMDPFGNLLRDPVIEINNWQNPAGGRA